jgi:hypothetical protein
MSELQPEKTVSISFHFHDIQQEFQVSISNSPTIDINDVAPDSVNCNTSFGYAGRHDHGQLPQLKNDPINGNLISSLQEAKKACDDFLTHSMQNESDKALQIATHQTEKKARLEEV